MKENTSLRHEGMLTQKTQREERERSPALWLFFVCVCVCVFFFFFLLSLGLPCVNWASWGPHSAPRAFLCSIFMGFPLPCLLATTILDSFPYSNYLTQASKNMKNYSKVHQNLKTYVVHKGLASGLLVPICNSLDSCHSPGPVFTLLCVATLCQIGELLNYFLPWDSTMASSLSGVRMLVLNIKLQIKRSYF